MYNIFVNAKQNSWRPLFNRSTIVFCMQKRREKEEKKMREREGERGKQKKSQNTIEKYII